ncbi:MAG: UDP-N-acetylmuramoyl-L-alanyl-D-glutamate--2,6-diaminopimelate ligase [Firmicutes bacterium]|nr:UDP-N-acetylmuramoyl-L-alanyl-D-glutamate--2,6-diaminopimelate ligase [Bacillota bacterium]
MNIKQILEVLDGECQAENLDSLLDKQIKELVYDSRKADRDCLFAAIVGENADGHQYIGNALAAGAAVILAQDSGKIPGGTPVILVKDSRRALAKIAAAFYDYPDRRLRLIGVTGTNGKTTVTNLIRWILQQNGRPCGLIGTIENKLGQRSVTSLNTTPESVEFFRMLREMEDNGCQAAVAEVSSHALSQGRVDGCFFRGAVFTNLTQDHLDYHQSMEQYRACKVRLFAMVGQAGGDGYGVINVDDPSAADFAQACAAPLWTYGMQQGAGLRLLSYASQTDGTDFDFRFEGQVYHAHVPLIGKFNIYNALAAIAVSLAEGLAMENVLEALSQAPQVPGRFELIDCGQDFSVVVDYAHTPDGLENVLRTARELTSRRLISVFGCGGNRDMAKRPVMGRIAGSLSDVAIITSDNPRFEDPMAIIEQIERGIKEICTNYLVEASRADAIGMALKLAEPGDMVVIAGKGHEDYQIVGNEKQHFDDREIVRQILNGGGAK